MKSESTELHDCIISHIFSKLSLKNLVKTSELPDCIISHIFSKLSLKNLVKTSALSKQWCHEWGLRKDLTFDLLNMFDYNTIQELPKTLPLFQQLQSQFATRLDYFMQKYPGDMISSIRVNFPLGVDHTDTIDGLIHKGLVKGANRIELLFAYETDLTIEPYKFLIPLLSDPNSLTYLHLQNCLIAETMEFSGLKNLKTLVLHLVPLEQDLCFNCIHLESLTLNECPFLSDLKITSTTLLHLNMNCGLMLNTPSKINIDIIASNLSSIEYSLDSTPELDLHTVNIKSHKLSKFSYRCTLSSNLVEFSGLKNLTTIVLGGLKGDDVITNLFSKCLQLEHVTLDNCWFMCGFKIMSAKLRHLSILRCYHLQGSSCKVDIDALNLSSFEYRGFLWVRSTISIEAPKLLKVFWDAGFDKINIYNFSATSRLHQPENLTMQMSLSQISKLMKEYMDQYQNLRQLELYIDGAYNPNMDYFRILDIAMDSQHLQKLSLTIRNGNTAEISSHING